MTFVFLKNWNGDPDGSWFEWDEAKMRLINFNGGGFDIDENTDYWAHAVIRCGCDSWHDLYINCGYNPMEVGIDAYDVWISPDGEFFEGIAHSVQAEKICKLVYNLDFEDILCHGDAEDHLISHGWVKATRSPMWSIYQTRDRTWYMTQSALDALADYCTFNRLKMPKNFEVISDDKAKLGGLYGSANARW